MSASDIREDLKAFIDGELSTERAAEVERAISENPALQQEAEDMKRITQSLRAMAHGPAITGEEKALKAVMPQTRRPSILSLGAVAAVALIAILVGPRLLRSTGAADETAVSLPRVPDDLPASTPFPGEPQAATGRISEDGSVNLNSKGSEMSSLPTRRPQGGGGGLAPHKDPTVATSVGAVVLPPDSDVARSVVRTASLSVKVDSAEAAERKVIALVKGYRGFVESSESGDLTSKAPVITMALRIPEKLFDDAMQAFQKLGVRSSQTVSGQDVTSQLVDMGARLKNLRVQEDTYRQILRQARRVGEVLEVQQHLSDIRSEIESMDAQAQSLRKLAALASISLTLEQRPSGPQAEANDGGWAQDAWASAAAALGGAMKSLASAGIWVFVYAPIWLPIAFFGWLLTKRIARA